MYIINLFYPQSSSDFWINSLINDVFLHDLQRPINHAAARALDSFGGAGWTIYGGVLKWGSPNYPSQICLVTFVKDIEKQMFKPW